MNHRAHLHSTYLPMSVYGTPYLWFESLQGTEKVNELYVYKLIVKTKDAKGLPAHSILGLEGYVGRDAYQDSILESKQQGDLGSGGDNAGDMTTFSYQQSAPSSAPISYQSPASHLDVLSLIGTPLGVSRREGAVGGVKDLREAVGQLTQSHQFHSSLLKLSSLHNTNETSLNLDIAENLKEDIDTLVGDDKNSLSNNTTKSNRYPELSKPHLLLTSAQSTTLTSDRHINLTSQKNTTLTAMGNFSIATAKNMLAQVAQGVRVFVQNLGIKLFSARGKIEIQAQSDDIEIIAEQVLKLISAKNNIEIVADKQIVLTSNGSYIKIDKEGIEIGSPKPVKVYAPEHWVLGAKEISYKFNGSPIVGTFDEKFVLQSHTGEKLSNFPYIITNKTTGEQIRGITDDEGGTVRVWTQSEEEVEMGVDLVRVFSKSSKDRG